MAGQRYASSVTDVFDRVKAMSVAPTLWPRNYADGSAFSMEPEFVGASPTFLVVKILMAESIVRVQAAARIAQDTDVANLGSHMVLLRPALVSAAKAAWLVRPDDHRDRAIRSAMLMAVDAAAGARAMKNAVKQGAPEVFVGVGNAFEDTCRTIISDIDDLTAQPNGRMPKDQDLVLELGSDIEQYYVDTSARSDVQILWNTASSLSHGERWYVGMTKGSRLEVANILTRRAFDVICNGLNVTSLRAMMLASRPPVGDE